MSRLERVHLQEMPEYALIRTACLDVISPFLVTLAAESRALLRALSDGLWNKRRENGATQPNARFIVLDPNGEYSRAFGSQDTRVKAQIFKVDPGTGELPLHVPIWFWNSAEWCSFAQASMKTQRPLLIQSLRNVRDGEIEPSANQSNEILTLSQNNCSNSPNREKFW